MDAKQGFRRSFRRMPTDFRRAVLWGLNRMPDCARGSSCGWRHLWLAVFPIPLTAQGLSYPGAPPVQRALPPRCLNCSAPPLSEHLFSPSVSPAPAPHRTQTPVPCKTQRPSCPINSPPSFCLPHRLTCPVSPAPRLTCQAPHQLHTSPALVSAAPRLTISARHRPRFACPAPLAIYACCIHFILQRSRSSGPWPHPKIGAEVADRTGTLLATPDRISVLTFMPGRHLLRTQAT